MSSHTSSGSLTSPGQNLQKWQKLFHGLPAELHINIMANLHGDPVSQICFGLTSSYFYWQIFHEVYDERSYVSGEKEYMIFSHPFDLRFQVSHCGQYSIFGWWDYGNLLDCWDINWNRSLGELLWEEKGLWHGLTCCNECQKFKPEEAFEIFEWETVAMHDARVCIRTDPSLSLSISHFSVQDQAFSTWIPSSCWATSTECLLNPLSPQAWAATSTRRFHSACRRCRTQELCMILGTGVVLQARPPHEERKSLGLSNDRDNFAPRLRAKPWELCAQQWDIGCFWSRKRYWQEVDAYNRNYETWESIFEEMGI